MVLDPKIWGPHYWFFLHTIALNYPLYPNDISKRKYYDVIETQRTCKVEQTISCNEY